ncbi:LysR family transcriptional regulator [Pseudomonas fontis]|uniref:LysR family transcriptional regulator n=1 Tax=Pseudomonas fontis TaxID=2942633 RepID=A0ABT5NWE9_9PSED|nr:LysR family transcriptional regulator [Pseudomonas fontis]MDD0973504.1 LysR family transcriptional regulator [Pseudomonas fontis]MDD0992515.1 LysR family transcriptional regulator [Pseudomonas fontis]
MNKLELLRTFVRVSELSSFTLAGECLGLPRSTVSEQVQALERLLGARLFNRTTRRVQATQDGLQLYERSKDLLSRMDEIEGLFRASPTELSGRLRVDLPTLMARRIILPSLPRFMALHPNLALEISCTDREVDLLREGFDCVLRIGALSDLAVVARPLGSLRMLNCASPGYLAQFGLPTTLAELSEHRLVHYVRSLGARSVGFEYVDGGKTQFQAMPGVITANNTDAYESAGLAGLGIIQAPYSGVREFLERGELVEVLPAHIPAPMPVSLLYAQQVHLPERVRVFMTWLAQVLATELDPVAGGS